MRKFIIIILLLFLSGCEKMSILNTVYISSIGLDYKDDEYIGYFYSPPTKDLSKSDNSDESTVYVIKDKELANIFNIMLDSAPITINMLHLKTMILSTNFKDISILLDYFRFSHLISYNFYMFSTEDDLAKLYEYKSISNVSNLYNFLNSPSLIDYKLYGINKCHFLTFANNYSNEYRTNTIPLVEMQYTSIKDDEFQLKLSGYNNLNNIYKNSEYKGITFLHSSNKEISYNNNIYFLHNYKVSFKEIDSLYSICIEYKDVCVSGEIDIEEYLYNEIKKLIDDVIRNEGEWDLINQYNYLYKKNLSNIKYQILINKNKNKSN